MACCTREPLLLIQAGTKSCPSPHCKHSPFGEAQVFSVSEKVLIMKPFSPHSFQLLRKLQCEPFFFCIKAAQAFIILSLKKGQGRGD